MFKVRKIKDSYYRHNFTVLLDILSELKVLDKYEYNLSRHNDEENNENHRQRLASKDNQYRSPTTLLIMSFNFSDSEEGVDFWQDIKNKVNKLQISRV